MNAAGEIVAFALLGALALFTFAMSDRDGTAARQINTRLAALEDNMVSRTIPRITIEGRGTVLQNRHRKPKVEDWYRG